MLANWGGAYHLTSSNFRFVFKNSTLNLSEGHGDDPCFSTCNGAVTRSIGRWSFQPVGQRRMWVPTEKNLGSTEEHEASHRRPPGKVPTPGAVFGVEPHGAGAPSSAWVPGSLGLDARVPCRTGRPVEDPNSQLMSYRPKIAGMMLAILEFH